MKRQDPLPAILNAADLSNPALANPAVAAQVAFASQGARLKNKTSEMNGRGGF
jgi:hypothetical protein